MTQVDLWRGGVTSGLHRLVRRFEPWGIVFTVLGLMLALITILVDLEDRQSERIFRAWQVVREFENRVVETNERAGAAGSAPRGAIEFLNRQFDGFLCILPVTVTSTVLTGNASRECLFPKKERESLANIALTGADLTDADLTDADLTDADLTDADLTRADLTRADLTRADLARADLTDADLTDTHLNGAFRLFADLTRATLRRADVRTYLAAANLTGADLTGADFTGAVLESADLTGADLTGADLTDAILRNGVNLTQPQLDACVR